jgi:hypothetical protein
MQNKFGYQNSFTGVNSEWIRHGFQNVVAHTWIAPQRAFYMTSSNWAVYESNFPLSTNYSLW